MKESSVYTQNLGVQYCTERKCEKYGYNDSFIRLEEFFSIQHILTDRNSKIYVVGVKLLVEKLYHNMYRYEKSSEYHLKEISKKIRPCVNVSIYKNGSKIDFISVCKPNTQIN